MRLSWFFSNIFDRILRYFGNIAGFLLLFLMLIICYEVAMRYFFAQPPGWVIEITEDILQYVVFLGAAWVLRQKGHVQVELLYYRLNPKKKLILDMFVSVIGAIMCLVLMWYSGGSTLDHFVRGEAAGVLRIPKGFLLAVIPLGFFLLTVEFIREALYRWRNRSNNEEMPQQVEL